MQKPFFLDHLDQKLFLMINSNANQFPLIDQLMIALSSHWMWIFSLPLLSYYAYLEYGKPKMWAWLTKLGVIIAITDSVAYRIFKMSIQRLRPCYTFENQVRLVVERCGSDYGMPSNHAANSMAIATLLLISSQTTNDNKSYSRIWKTVVVGLCASIGFSRVYLGVHYPADILAGFLLGGTITWGVSKIQLKLLPRLFSSSEM